MTGNVSAPVETWNGKTLELVGSILPTSDIPREFVPLQSPFRESETDCCVGDGNSRRTRLELPSDGQLPQRRMVSFVAIRLQEEETPRKENLLVKISRRAIAQTR